MAEANILVGSISMDIAHSRCVAMIGPIVLVVESKNFVNFIWFFPCSCKFSIILTLLSNVCHSENQATLRIFSI